MNLYFITRDRDDAGCAFRLFKAYPPVRNEREGIWVSGSSTTDTEVRVGKRALKKLAIDFDAYTDLTYDNDPIRIVITN